MTLRVALDLDGSLETLRNSMVELADALEQRSDCQLVPFRTRSAAGPDERALRGRHMFGPLWRHSMGPSIDRQFMDVSVIHVAGVVTPPTNKIPLIISVDDLRPFRDEARTQHRLTQLQRAVDRGARIVASSRTAAHEVQDVLGLARTQFAVVRPPVGSITATHDGRRLVVNITGLIERFVTIAPSLTQFCRSVQADLVVVGSSSTASRIRAEGIAATFVHRSNAFEAIGQARVVINMSDGAKFPSFAIAALAAGVPTMARASEINRELLGGAAALIFEDNEIMENLVSLWSDEARRAIAIAAGHHRARDFSPWEVASVYAALYADVTRQHV